METLILSHNLPSKNFHIEMCIRDRHVSWRTRTAIFPEDEAGLCLNKYWFDKTLQNGKKVNRTWMCFSPTKKIYSAFVAFYFHKKNDKETISILKMGFRRGES